MELQPFLSILGRYKSHRISAGPFAAWYNWKESHPGQFYLLYRAALFVCPGSDTFLMNYTNIGIKKKYKILQFSVSEMDVWRATEALTRLNRDWEVYW